MTNPSGSATFTIGATTLTINEQASSTYAGTIQDGSSYSGGTVALGGPGTLTLTGANTYTGSTRVSGTLALTGSGSIAASQIVNVAAGGVLDVSGASAAVSINKLIGAAGSTLTLGATALSLNETSAGQFSGTIQNGASGAGGTLTIGGTGPLTLSGVSTYTGSTRISGALALKGKGSIAASQIVNLVAAGAVLDVSGASAAVSINKLIGAAGSTLTLGATSLALNETSAGQFSGTIQNGASGAGGTLTIGGTGQLTLSGASTYTDSTRISGTLALKGKGSIAASQVVNLVAAGAVLDVSGASAAVSIDKLIGAAGSTVDLGATSLSVNETSAGQFNGTIQNGPNGAGGKLVVNGTGPLTLKGKNTYTGGTTLAGGTLELAAAGAAGTGTITFAGAATLKIDAPALTSTGSNTSNFANLIAGATSTSQVIDLASLAYTQGSTTATETGSTVSVTDGSAAVTLHLASAQPNAVWYTAKDATGGTLVYDPPATQPTASAAGVDHSWVEMAMADWGGVTGDMHAHATGHEAQGAALGLSADQAHAAAVFGHGAHRMG